MQERFVRMRRIAVGSILALCATVIFLQSVKLKSIQLDLSDLQDELDSKQHEIQKFSKELGLANSTIVKQNELIDQYEQDKKTGTVAPVKTKLKPISRDQVNVAVSGIADTGSQTSEQAVPGITSYTWSDKANRFHLVDPNIKQSGDEQFDYRLKIKITGYVLADPSGKVQARQVAAQEVYHDENGEHLGEKLEIESSTFQYIKTVKPRSLLDIFHLRAYSQFDSLANPGLGLEFANFGYYEPYVNIGMGSYVAIDTASLPGSLPSSRFGIGLQYWLIPPAFSTNIGVGLGISTPLDDFAGRFIISGNLVFYLSN